MPARNLTLERAVAFFEFKKCQGRGHELTTSLTNQNMKSIGLNVRIVLYRARMAGLGGRGIPPSEGKTPVSTLRFHREGC